MGMNPEQAAAAIHAAKVAQKMAMERNFDKLPPNFFPPHLDISKITNQDSASKNLNLPNVTIEPTSNSKSLNMSGNSGLDIRRSDSSDRDRDEQPQHSISNNNNNNNINNYNKEESSADERNLSDDENSIAVN
jgi:hypothetical protein